MARRKKTYNLDRLIVNALRKISRWDPIKRQCLKEARVGPDAYKCKKCREIFPEECIQVDHIIPIVKLQGITSWDEYIDALFCHIDGRQALCLECHSVKTLAENAKRKAAKSKSK